MNTRPIRELKTERLLLRAWRPEDRAPYAALNADAEVMQYLLGPMTREKSAEQIESFQQDFVANEFGRWAVEVPGVSPFIGMVGLSVVPYQAHFTPAVQIAWRLARGHWGRGYASEAASAALAFGFEVAGLREIVAMTVPVNLRSQAVMQKLGMTQNPADDFDHPSVPARHPLVRHVLYRMTDDDWRRANRPARLPVPRPSAV